MRCLRKIYIRNFRIIVIFFVYLGETIYNFSQIVCSDGQGKPASKIGRNLHSWSSSSSHQSLFIRITVRYSVLVRTQSFFNQLLNPVWQNIKLVYLIFKGNPSSLFTFIHGKHASK